MLLVLFGNSLVSLEALVGGGGSGRSCVVLTGCDLKNDFREVIEPPDLLRL